MGLGLVFLRKISSSQREIKEASGGQRGGEARGTLQVRVVEPKETKIR